MYSNSIEEEKRKKWEEDITSPFFIMQKTVQSEEESNSNQYYWPLNEDNKKDDLPDKNSDHPLPHYYIVPSPTLSSQKNSKVGKDDNSQIKSIDGKMDTLMYIELNTSLRIVSINFIYDQWMNAPPFIPQKSLLSSKGN